MRLTESPGVLDQQQQALGGQSPAGCSHHCQRGRRGCRHSSNTASQSCLSLWGPQVGTIMDADVGHGALCHPPGSLLLPLSLPSLPSLLGVSLIPS